MDTMGLIFSFAGVCVVNVTAVATVYLQTTNRSNRTDAKIDEVGAGVDTASAAAADAATYAKPVSNGFTKNVLTGMARIEAEQIASRDERKEDRAIVVEALKLISKHLGDHAAADVMRKTNGT